MSAVDADNPALRIALAVSPLGRPHVEVAAESDAAPALPAAVASRVEAAFVAGAPQGLLHLATAELQTPLPASLSYARDLARDYLACLCRASGLDTSAELPPVAAPPAEALAFRRLQAPPMTGLEYVSGEALAAWWTELDEFVRGEIRLFPGGAQAYLRQKNPLWRLVGRVTFHLAENKRDEQHPFAFMASYVSHLSAQGRLQHLPMAKALQEYAGAKNRQALIALLSPIQAASEKIALVKALVDSGDIYRPLAWTPRQAHAFLQEIPAMEDAGLVVRVPDWWKAKRPPRPVVNATIGKAKTAALNADALLDYSVDVCLDGQSLSEEDIQALLADEEGLVRLKGQWVEVDRAKLSAALEHWKGIEQRVRDGGLTFFEGMRLLSGVGAGDGAEDAPQQSLEQWSRVTAGAWLAETLEALRNPQRLDGGAPRDLKATLRPYQHVGMRWLEFLSQLKLGACLADDMGLGKTVQVLALLLEVRSRRQSGEPLSPSVLVVPASLIANWRTEIERFAPSLEAWVAHPSEQPDCMSDPGAALDRQDLVITTYGMAARLEWLLRRQWNLVILDEAQAIKNSGTRQTRAVKELKAAARIALTGTPVENRLGDLWSLFDFLNSGLLGSAKEFGQYAKALEQRQRNSYAPLRSLVQPYILRRLKTDKSVIADLPDKTEMKMYCGLSPRQAAIYEQSVKELSTLLEISAGIARKGAVLSFLMRLKQICNHPSQWLGDNAYAAADSGKFQRLADICQELAQRQEKALIFTQFREIADPLAGHLQGVFGREGLVLHGQTPVARRREMVDAFQQEDGPPFFVLSLKAGGVGLNLTAATHVIHFDRWWNPAVENQATDRAFRIGQKRNVLVHKFICRGTVEEKIDELIESKVSLANDLLGKGGAERMLTEMSNDELLRFVALDISKTSEV
ncbi:MAG: DEAD/DEAH box helicase [Planctomycetaceae bacterium]|nr:DEAD/DEAH box helicase [Planctomycetaceae bacterium]